ncbi:MAG: hypothetical protein ACXABD_07670 [Candidatus Thorarchaeota archaeon]|jgi:hypothetical protein
MGLFGTSAEILVDINLILQYTTLILLLVGYVKRKTFKNHGYTMMVVLVITVGTTVLVMAPRLLATFAVYGPFIFVHSAIGILSMLLGALFSFRFIVAIQNEKPLLCGTKNMMRLAFILWVGPIISGTLMYFTLYV